MIIQREKGQRLAACHAKGLSRHVLRCCLVTLSLVAVAACSNRHRGLNDEVPSEDAGAAADESSEAGNAGGGASGEGGSGAGDGSQDGAGSGASGGSGGSAVNDPEAGDGSGDDPGAGGVGGSMIGTGGSAGEPPGFPGGGSRGSQILNPFNCDTQLPFVLSIEPDRERGHVSGWLESAPRVIFVDRRPRFARQSGPPAAGASDTPEGAIALWWSIAGLRPNGDGTLYFYAGDFTGSPTELAVAEDASEFEDVDLDALTFSMQTTEEIGRGAILVFRNAETLEAVALRVDSVLAADGGDGMDGLCAALEASWSFAL